MDRVKFRRWELCTDREATQEAYRRIHQGGPETCDCAYCRNFVAARERVYPKKVLELFDALGIPFNKEVEVYELGRLGSGFRLYGGWFHCFGQVEVADTPVSDFDLQDGMAPFELSFHARPSLVPDCFQGSPLIQVEFHAQAPWVLEEIEPST